MSQAGDFASAACQFKLGPGRQIEVEVERSRVWAAVGESVREVDVWMKRIAEVIDLRVRLERTDRGLAISIDRGDNPGAWFEDREAPKLLVEIEQDLSVQVTSTKGGCVEHILGRVSLRDQA